MCPKLFKNLPYISFLNNLPTKRAFVAGTLHRRTVENPLCCISGEEIFANHPLESFMESVTLEGVGFESPVSSEHEPSHVESTAGEFELPCEHRARQRPPCLLLLQEISFFYVLPSDEAQWEAAGSVLMTLVPTHLHPKAVSPAFCCRDSLWRRDMGGRAVAGTRPWLSTGRHRSVYGDVLQNNTSWLYGSGFFS